jgi:hypothetical protein
LKNQIRITKTKEMIFKLKDQFHRFTDLIIKLAEQRFASSSSIKQVNNFFLNLAVTRTLADSPSVRRLFRAWAIFGWDVHNCTHTSRSYPSYILCRSILNRHRATAIFKGSSQRPQSYYRASKRNYLYRLSWMPIPSGRGQCRSEMSIARSRRPTVLTSSTFPLLW